MDAEAAIVLLEEGAQEIAAQSAAGTPLITGLLGGGRFTVAGTGPAIERTQEKIAFDPALAQEGIHLVKALAECVVVDVADDGGQSGTKFFRKGKDLAGHAISL